MNTLTIHSEPPIVAHPVELSDERAGLNGEVPNLTATLDNSRGRLTTLFGIPPLRARATLEQQGVPVFVGTVQSITLQDQTITLTLEG